MPSIITSIFQGSSLFNSAKPIFMPSAHSKIGEVIIDATHAETIEYAAKVTEHPIETKTAISDHIFKQPLRIRVEGSITDSSIKFMGIFEMPIQNNSLAKITNNLKSFLPFGDSVKPSRQAYLLLKNIYEQRQLVNVVSKFEAFNNMAIEKLTFSSDEDTGERLQFSAEMVQISFANVRSRLSICPKDKKLKALTAEKVNVGTKQMQQESQTSMAKKAINSITGLWIN